MRKLLVLSLLVSIVSISLLSVLSNMLVGYPEHLPADQEQANYDTEKMPSKLLFKVSPATPKLFWSISTADYYTGFTWLRTTDEKALEEFPPFPFTNATKVFSVELNMPQQEILIPIASPDSALANISSSPLEDLRFRVDTVGNAYKVIRGGKAEEINLLYKASWRDIEIDDSLVSLDHIPEEIQNRYLQLPYISTEVWKLAKDLEVPSYSVLDQILADIQFLRTNFVYDYELAQSYWRTYTSGAQGSDVSSYIRTRKGVCIDAATALAVILRIQKKPARISFGFKPENIQEGKLFYYTAGAHALTEVYLPPYGWIRFDATPPLGEDPLLNVIPFKKGFSPGSILFYQLLVTNRGAITDSFRLFAQSKQKWNVEVIPEVLRIDPLQTTYALLKINISESARLGEKDVVTITVVAMNRPKAEFSARVIVQVDDVVRAPIRMSIKYTYETVIRGNAFWVNGSVFAADNGPVDNTTVFVLLTRAKEAEGVIVGKGYSEKGSFGIRCIVPTFVEVGDYKVVVTSLETMQYASSGSASIIRVCATTRLAFGTEEEFLLGYGAIRGSILWDNGTGFAHAPISFKITPLAKSSEVRNFQNSTLEDGTFRIETKFEDPGAYEVKALYSGNEYVLGSEATLVARMKRGQPEVQVLCDNIATRGQCFNVTGTLLFESKIVWGEPLAVYFDDSMLTTVEIKENGFYAVSFPISPQEELGLHDLTVKLEKAHVSSVRTIMVKSKTALSARVSDVAGGMFVLFSASLSDDRGIPVPEANVVIDDYGLSMKTDKNGNLTLLLDTIKFWPENSVLTVRFDGSKSYLPVATKKEIFINPLISLPFFIPLASPIIVVVAVAYDLNQERRRRMCQQTSEVGIPERRAIVKEELVQILQETQPLQILLPDVEAQLPNVWGVKDKLRIQIVLDRSCLETGQEVEVWIDKRTVGSVRLYQRAQAELSHMFTQKGDHDIRAILPRGTGFQPWNAEIKLRVVDYEEEIIRLYNGFIAKLTDYGLLAGGEKTAREIESYISSVSALGSEALDRVTTCFEKAEYSNRMITRLDYRIMYASLKELDIDVE
jgi:transglutaminase-like putative cysteine protease